MLQKGGIGFFDSGVGGLSVLRACEDVLCGYPVYYYGDNANAPYGNRPIYEVRAYVREAFDFFARMDALAVVVACNTVTALLIDELRAAYAFPIVGVEPAVFPAAKVGKRLLVVATKATASSLRLKNLVNRVQIAYPNVEIKVFGSEKLAELVESGFDGAPSELSRYLPTENPDCVVLGCTHYSFLSEKIGEYYGAKVFDGNDGVSQRLSMVLGASKKCTVKRGFGDGCPLGNCLLSSLPFFLQKSKAKKSFFRLKKHGVYVKVKNALTLYFVGSGAVKNLLFYERMFGF